MSFAMDQSDDGNIKSARIRIPGCGNNHIHNGPPVAVEIDGDKVTLVVFGDINSKVPTHEIDISGALEKKRVKEE